MTVVDASAIVDLLAPPDAARRDFLVGEVPEPTVPWLAPDVLLFEVFAVMRLHLHRSAITQSHAAAALRRLLRLPIELTPTAKLISTAWPLRERFSAADSLYTALSLRATQPLLTTDLRLARAAAGLGIDVRSPV